MTSSARYIVEKIYRDGRIRLYHPHFGRIETTLDKVKLYGRKIMPYIDTRKIQDRHITRDIYRLGIYIKIGVDGVYAIKTAEVDANG